MALPYFVMVILLRRFRFISCLGFCGITCFPYIYSVPLSLGFSFFYDKSLFVGFSGNLTVVLWFRVVLPKMPTVVFVGVRGFPETVSVGFREPRVFLVAFGASKMR